METKILDFKDKENVINLEKLTNKHMRITKSEIISNEFIKTLDNYLDPTVDDRILFGNFNDKNELICILGIFLWKNLPYYTQLFLKTQGNSYGWDNNGIKECWNMMLEYCEQNNRYTFYYARSTKWPGSKLSEKFFETVPKYKRYIRAVEEVIEKNNKSKFPYFNNIIGNFSLSTDVVIIQNTLRPEYRPNSFINNFVEGIDFNTGE